MKSRPDTLTVGQVAARCGVSIATIHFYEARGLIRGWRTAGNQRRYPRAVLRSVAVVKVAQRMGIPLRVIHAAGAIAARRMHSHGAGLGCAVRAVPDGTGSADLRIDGASG
jgi:redox-sensitive transcriptional activator SoxR